MRRMTYFVMALALVLGFTQCKKEQPLEPLGEQVRITLNVDKGDNGAKVNVTGPDVTFTKGDKIIVACVGQYRGTLTHNGTNFSGVIDSPTEGKYLYFYFFGNKAPKSVSGNDIAVGDLDCSVDISDQSSELPVISMAPSTEPYSSSVSSYSARLHNKCSLMKFKVSFHNVPVVENHPIYITGMNNKVRVWFNKFNNTDAFSYSGQDANGIIKMKGVTAEGGETWAIVLEQDAMSQGASGSAYTTGYKGYRPGLQNIWNTHYYDTENTIVINEEDGSRTINLAGVDKDTIIPDSYRVYGTLANNVKISIADGATVTLNGVSINASGTWTSGDYAGISCLGDANIILEGTNTVKGFDQNYPGIYIAENKTLTINGTGSLNASSNGWGGAGIGSGISGNSCGNIVINGGTINATGGTWCAGIGSGYGNGCGYITINGGNVTANGGQGAAGIGAGFGHVGTSSCGDITITGGTVEAVGGDGGMVGNVSCKGGAGIGTGSVNGGGSSCGTINIGTGVTSVSATKGSGATYSIGAGYNGSCGTVTIDEREMTTSELSSPPTGDAVFTNFTSVLSNSDKTWTLTHK